jgi:hypothetical protein
MGRFLEKNMSLSFMQNRNYVGSKQARSTTFNVDMQYEI